MKDRVRQFEAYLAQVLEAFKLRHENEVTRIPRAIRNLTMAEFADKYDGDVNKALQAMTKAKMALSGEPVGIEDTARKRWSGIPSHFACQAHVRC
ncbi:MAG TPA: borealin N-terminal domain-containing protein [Chlamydiales bacterium]|nr:borealin N-terminal domain-containing protein [Chlamydiales bacterium]